MRIEDVKTRGSLRGTLLVLAVLALGAFVGANAPREAQAMMPSSKGLIFTKGAAVTKSDTTEVPFVTLYVGGAGTVNIMQNDDTQVAFTAVAGGYLYVTGHRIMSTGTSATLIVALN